MNSNSTPTRRWPGLVLAFAIVCLCAVVSAALLYTSPQTQREERKRPPRLVRTIRVEPRTERIVVTAHGVVIPARQVVMQAQVNGRVVRQHESLVPGGRIPRGAELIRIDPADYDLALAEKEAALEEAEFELAVEKGRQVVASREWKLLQGDLPDSEANRSLALREPHLKKAEALVRKAKNLIAVAKLDLSRTEVVAPFNAVVLEEKMEIGQLVDRGLEVCTLAGSDEFWVRVSLPIEKLRWITFPNGTSPGAAATVFLDTGEGESVGRDGRVVRLLGDLETKGRMARILISVHDPLTGKNKQPLLLGSYVRVEIDAGTLGDVLAVPRSAVREGNMLWVVNPEQRLDIRKANVLWSRADTVLVASECIAENESLVVSGLRTALPQMLVSAQPVTDHESKGAGSDG